MIHARMVCERGCRYRQARTTLILEVVNESIPEGGSRCRSSIGGYECRYCWARVGGVP